MTEDESAPVLVIPHVTLWASLCSILTLISGCSGISGAVAGAAISGYIGGAALGSQREPQRGSVDWPFENNPQNLRLECEGGRFLIELSTAKALMIIREEKLELKRDFSVYERFGYRRMSMVEQDEQELFVTEIDNQEFKVDRFTLLGQERAELYYEGVLIACNYETRETILSADG
jgi:hypothetical protein